MDRSDLRERAEQEIDRERETERLDTDTRVLRAHVYTHSLSHTVTPSGRVRIRSRIFAVQLAQFPLNPNPRPFKNL